jgi:hypothetical protein
MHRCSVKCCENTTASIDDVQRCVEACAMPLSKAQNYMQQEVENFQVSTGNNIEQLKFSSYL